jgi:hypothetical protein
MLERPNWEMDLTQQITANVVFGILVLLCMVHAHRVARAMDSRIPYWVLLGSALTTPHEVISNVLGHCTYPEINQFTAFTLLDRSYPTYLVLDYTFYFGFAINALLLMLHRAQITFRKWMTYFCVAIVFAALYDPIFVHLGWWGYYGPAQYPSALGFPMWWWFENAQIMFVITAMIHLVRPWMGTSRVWLVALLIPFGTLMAHGTAALPFYAALNSEHPSNFYSLIGTIFSALLSFAFIYITGKLVTSDEAAMGGAPREAGAS